MRKNINEKNRRFKTRFIQTKYYFFLMIYFLFSSFSNLEAQEKLVLEKQKNPNRQKVLNLERSYSIVIDDTTLYYRKIIAFTDTSLLIPTRIKTDRDTSYSYSYSISKDKDTTVVKTHSIYKNDTLSIAFGEIKMISKDWFENRRWLEPFAWLGMGAVLGVAMLPVAAIDKGNEGIKEWVAFEALIIGICGPPLFIGTRKTNFDLKDKWTLKTVDPNQP